MKYIEEYRKTDLQKNLVKKIHKISKKLKKNIILMEVCGTHTVSIGRFGIRSLMPENIKLISGPGCPVCVTPTSYIDKAILLSKMKDVILATFGDMLRVPGSFSSLEKEKANGSKIFVFYSPYDALKLAEENLDKIVVFLSIGFETTTPLIAETIKIAKEKNIKNFFILCGSKLIPPIMEFLSQDKEIEIDGFICPGHVSVIIGANSYKFIPDKYKIPCVISGFEPVDILFSIYLILKSLINDRPKVINEYKRVVRDNGNIIAQQVLYSVFEPSDSEWRGIGNVKNSGLRLREEYKEFDIEEKIKINIGEVKEKKSCFCGEILKGKKIPFDCPLFEKICNPSNPVGPCMVSFEGTCSTYYKYERR
ncbi:MAG: hydrogenase formation protein HypD [Candidatus Omnitrophica bacterium]|nr:hydrogenase formation protein HypD [Candidatus Omnitrophota bacterium]